MEAETIVWKLFFFSPFKCNVKCFIALAVDLLLETSQAIAN